jgi:antitoxin ParD1/3/4
MASTINLSLTDELRKFIDRNCGDDALYSTPSEFIRDLLREKKESQEAAALRDGVLEGYRDLLEGRTVEFTGDLKAALQEARLKEKSGW